VFQYQSHWLNYSQEKVEDTKGVIRIRKSKKNRQHNDQMTKGQKDKQRSTKHTHKTKYRVTRTPLKTWDELRWTGRVSSSCSTMFLLEAASQPTNITWWSSLRLPYLQSHFYLFKASCKYLFCLSLSIFYLRNIKRNGLDTS
jgi:hypothetical protein